MHDWLQSLPPEAGFGLDAGFISAEKELTQRVYLPAKLRGEEYFTPQQAIVSRKLTRWRGAVERANRRLKLSKLLSVTFHNSSLINAELFVHISAILGNKYGHALSQLASQEERDFHSYFQ